MQECAENCFEAFAIAQEFGYCRAKNFGDWFTVAERQAAIETIWRVSESGLIKCIDWVPVYDEHGKAKPFSLSDLVEPYEGDTTNSAAWCGMDFILTPAGKALAEDFHLNMDLKETPPGFEARLWEIFIQHGVGPDVRCPYQLPPDWKPTEYEQVDGVWRQKP